MKEFSGLSQFAFFRNFDPIKSQKIIKLPNPNPDPWPIIMRVSFSSGESYRNLYWNTLDTSLSKINISI